MKTWQKVVVVLAVLVGTCGFAFYEFRQTPWGHVLFPPSEIPLASDVPLLSIPPWPGTLLGGQTLWIRYGGEGVNELLVTRGSIDQAPAATELIWPVYRYDARVRQLDEVDQVRWDGEKNPIAGILSVSRRVHSYEVAHEGSTISLRDPDGLQPIGFNTEGEYALRVTASPVPNIVALLTADGPRRPKTKGPGMGIGNVGGGFYGQHYVEFYRVPELIRIGNPVRIPFTTVRGIDYPCWSEDGRYLVYGDSGLVNICVIHVPSVD